MRSKMFVCCAFVVAAMICGCSLDTVDAYNSETPCGNVKKITSTTDRDVVEIYCRSSLEADVNDGEARCEYIRHDLASGEISDEIEPEMIYAFSSSQCPVGYACKYDGNDGLCVRSVCGGVPVDMDSDNKNCGECGNECKRGTYCSRGECVCAEGFVLCGEGDGRRCIDPLTNTEFCGASGSCSGNDVGKRCKEGELCLNGSCVLTCANGQIDCGGKCIKPQTDTEHCGARGSCLGDEAGKECAVGEMCLYGVCTVTCVSDQVNCDGKCINPQTDIEHCGASGSCSGNNAGKRCKEGEVCSEGECRVTCVSGQINCGGKCIDPLRDNDYCGASGSCLNDEAGQKCEEGKVCSDGVCGLTCPKGQIICGDRCVDPERDNEFCGASGSCNDEAAGKTCIQGQSCTDGKCLLVTCIRSNETLCDLNGEKTCANLTSDVDHCGKCGFKCSAHAPLGSYVTGCFDGICKYTCRPGFLNSGSGNTASTLQCTSTAFLPLNPLDPRLPTDQEFPDIQIYHLPVEINPINPL